MEIERFSGDQAGTAQTAGSSPPTNGPVINALKAELWQALTTAMQYPTAAELSPLYIVLDRVMAGRPLAAQLEIAGTVLLQLSEIYAARFDSSIADWEAQHQPIEPVISLETCVELVVQSLSLNLSELFEAATSVQYPAHRKSAAGSRVAEVDKASLLQLADQLEQAQWVQDAELPNLDFAAQIWHLAHDENVEQWSARIKEFLQAASQEAASQGCFLFDIQQQLNMPLIELWLGLLLGGHRLEQRGEFYDGQSIWVSNSLDASQ